jgi:hypothetical protein
MIERLRVGQGSKVSYLFSVKDAYALTGLIQIMCLRTTIGGEYSFEKIMEFILDFMLKVLEPEKSAPDGDPEKSFL